MPFRVLVSDPLAAEAVAAMRDAGLEVDEPSDLSEDQLAQRIGGYDAIVIRSATKLRAKLLDAVSGLQLIVRAGVGLDNVDVDVAQSKGIVVRNTPAASSNSVAELALGHILSLARHIGRGTASMKGGGWEKKALKGIEIDGKTLGIIGIGRIGQALATKAGALGMRVICCDAYVDECPIPGVATMCTFDRLVAESDFISLHVPYDPAVGPVLGGEQFTKMKDGVRIVNCARGGVVDETALAAAMNTGKVAGAALDVFEEEPPPSDHPLFALDAVSLTPHIGASTVEAQARVGAEAAQIVIDFAATRE